MHDGLVFSGTEDVPDGTQRQTIAGARLGRQLVWLFQFARASTFPGEAQFVDFQLEVEWRLQVLPLTKNGYGQDVCELDEVRPDHLQPPLQLKLTWGAGATFNYLVSTQDQAKAMQDGAMLESC